MLFYRLMEQAVMTAPLPYRQIVQRKHNLKGELALNGYPHFIFLHKKIDKGLRSW